MLFDFEIDYYKPSGKWYANERFKMDVEPCGPENHEIPYNPVKVFRATFGGRQCCLPGLSGKTWEGYAVLVHVTDHGDGKVERGLSYHMVCPGVTRC